MDINLFLIISLCLFLTGLVYLRKNNNHYIKKLEDEILLERELHTNTVDLLQYFEDKYF